MANTNLQVTFTSIDVHRDGDPIDRGELYWSLRVDGVAVSTRLSDVKGRARDARERKSVTDILVVDDSRVMRDMIIACLRGRDGFDFAQAGSGLEAIERLSLKPFSLVILDLNMPDVGGLEVIEFIRTQDKLRDVPILIVTTRGDEQSRDQALAAGATRFMTKPFAPELIQQEVEALLRSAQISLLKASFEQNDRPSRPRQKVNYLAVVVPALDFHEHQQ